VNVTVTAVAFSSVLILTVVGTRVITRIDAQRAERSGLRAYDGPPTGRNIPDKPSGNRLRDSPPTPPRPALGAAAGTSAWSG
jgi:hypothetical protein